MTCEPVPSAPVRRRARRAGRWAGRSNRVSEVGRGPGLQAGSSPARLPRAAPDTAARPVRRAAARFELVIVAPWFVYCKFHDWTKTRSAPGTPSSHASSYMPSWATQQPREGGTAVGRKPVTGLVGRIRRRTKTIKREAKESSGLLCILRVLRQRGDGAQCSVPWCDNLESQTEPIHRRAPPGTPANLGTFVTHTCPSSVFYFSTSRPSRHTGALGNSLLNSSISRGTARLGVNFA